MRLRCDQSPLGFTFDSWLIKGESAAESGTSTKYHLFFDPISMLLVKQLVL